MTLVFCYICIRKRNEMIMRKSVFESYIKDYIKDLTDKNRLKHRCRHGAVLTYNDVIISSGTNVQVMNDFTKSYDDVGLTTLHAEPVAIMRAMKKHSKVIDKCELWVCRTNDNAKFSKPCPMCERIIKSFGIKKVHYTDENDNWVDENL